MVDKSPKCSTWMQSQKRQNDLCSFPRQTIQYHGNPSLYPTNNTEEAEVERFYEDLQDLLEPTPKKDVLFTSFPGGSEVKASAPNAGDLGSIPGLERFPGEVNGNPLQYSCLENPIDGEA